MFKFLIGVVLGSLFLVLFSLATAPLAEMKYLFGELPMGTADPYGILLPRGLWRILGGPEPGPEAYGPCCGVK